jgi:Ca-activated chloride channel family protein
MKKKDLIHVTFFMSVIFLVAASVATVRGQQQSAAAEPGQSGDVVVPARPAVPLFTGKSGPQESEVVFVPVTRRVTLKIHVEDPNGYFLPNIRRENFAVFEDGVRQQNVNVDIEHAPVTVALLVEYGGRFHEFNRELAYEGPMLGRHLGEVLTNRDRSAVFKYSGKLGEVAGFTPGSEAFYKALDHLGTPESSEVNLYDALVDCLNGLRTVTGRRAIVLISTGLDTFSKTNFDQAVQAVRTAGIPIYAIELAGLVHREVSEFGSDAPFSRIDWSTAQKRLETLASTSGGRIYALQADSAAPAIYDDIMENLRIRYVISYVSSNPSSGGPERNIRVDLIDPNSGQPLKIRDATGKVVSASIFMQQTYLPVATASD